MIGSKKMYLSVSFLYFFTFLVKLSRPLEVDYYSNYKCLLDPDEEEIVFSNLTIIDSRFAAFSQGDLSRDLLWTVRGKKDQSYYQEIVKNIIVYTCQDSESERCVPEGSDDVAKDDDGECVVAGDSACPQGMCERTANCYWNDVQPGLNRSIRYPNITRFSAEKKLFDYLDGKSYVRQVAYPSIIAIAVALGLLLLWTLYFIARYCCCCLWTTCSLCRLCSPIPNENGYRACLHWMIPIFFYIAGFFCIVFSGAIALIGNQDVDYALNESFAYLLQLVDNFGIFLTQVLRPLNMINAIIDRAASDAFAIFRDTGFVKAIAVLIQEAFVYLSTDRGYSSGAAAIVQSISSASDTFQANIDPIVEDIDTMLTTLETGLYNNVDTIRASLDSIIGSVSSFETVQSSLFSSLLDYQHIENDSRPFRLGGILFMFVFGATIALAGLIGISSSRNRRLKKLHGLMNITAIVSAFIGTVTLIIASLTLLFSFIWMDLCELEQVVISDLEPFLGKTAAQGAKAIFDGQNLTSAFNISDDLDFESILNDGLDRIGSVNISDQFNSLLSGFDGIDEGVQQVSISLFEAFESAMNQSNSSSCSFDQDIYFIEYMTTPWIANANKTLTSWNSLSTGSLISYARVADENAVEYFQRIYSVAGVCTENSTNCCLNEECFIGVSSSCNHGTGCQYDDFCTFSSSVVQDLATEFLRFYNDSRDIGSDLGIYCDSFQCLTPGYQMAGFNESLMATISSFGEKIDATAVSLVNLTENSVGEVITQVEKLLCKDISFVADGYHSVREEVCTSMLGGFTQINWALWILAVMLEFVALLINTLSTRLKGMTQKEAKAATEIVSAWKGSRDHGSGSRHTLNRSGTSSGSNV